MRILSLKLAIYTLLVICSLCCDTAFAARNGESRSVEASYVIRSLGSDIGTVRAETVGTASDNDFRADVKVNVSFLFFSFSLTSIEMASIRGGKLVSYHKIEDTKGQRREISGKLDGDIFSMVVRKGGTSEHKEFPTKGYVTTNMEYPELTLTPGEVRRMRVIDLDNAEIVDRVYRHVAEEQTEINGRGSRVMVTDFTDNNSDAKRWTAVINGLPIVTRQEGKEKTGLFNPSYSVRQIRITTDP